MKNLIRLSLLLLLSTPAFSQKEAFLRFYNYRPTGEFGAVMKPAYSAEIGYGSSFDEDTRFRYHASLTYLIMKPRLDSFPIYGILHDGTGDHVLPGNQSFQKYNIGQLFGGFDIAFIKQDPFYAYAGFDITIGAATVEYTDYVATVKDESYTGGGILGGVRFRIGAQYDINENIAVSVNANRGGWLLSDPAAINWANDYGVSITYKFE